MKKTWLWSLMALSLSAAAQNVVPKKHEIVQMIYGWNSLSFEYNVNPSNQSVSLSDAYFYCYNLHDRYDLKVSPIVVGAKRQRYTIEPNEVSSLPSWVDFWATSGSDGEIRLHVETESSDPVEYEIQ